MDQQEYLKRMRQGFNNKLGSEDPEQPQEQPSPLPQPQDPAQQDTSRNMEEVDAPGQKDGMFRSIGNYLTNQAKKANEQDKAMWQAANQGDYTKLADNAMGMATMGSLGAVGGLEKTAADEVAGGLRMSGPKPSNFAPDAVEAAKANFNKVYEMAQRGEANMSNVKAAQQALDSAMNVADRHAAQVGSPKYQGLRKALGR